MRTSSLFWKYAFFLCFFLCAKVAYGGPVTEVERKQDPRLEKPVTLLSPRVYYLGELLEELSRQTGVTLRADDKDKAAGELVLVRVQSLPLCDVMNALYSLVSYRDAVWDWEAKTEPATEGNAAYQLIRPRTAQRLGARLRQRTQEGFEAEATSLLSNLDKMVEDIKGLEKKGDKDGSRAWKRTHAELEAFAEIFPSSEAQLRALRGHDQVQVPVSALGEKARAYVDAEMALKRELNPRFTYPKPQQVKVVREQFTGNVTPSLMICIGNGRTMEGFTCIGGTDLENQWRQTVAAQWLLPDDKAEDARLESKIKAKVGAAPQGTEPALQIPLNGATLRLWECAEGASLSLIACLPGNGTSDRGSPYNQTVRTALTKLDPLQTKWRTGILLVRDPSWFVRETEEGRVSWSLVKKLREAEETAADGLLPLKVLADTARDLSPEQLQNMSGEFPVLSQIAVWHNWFVQMGQTPDLLERLQSPKGVSVQVMRVLTTGVLPPEVPASKVAAVRLRVEDSPRQDQQPTKRSIVFELLSSQGLVLGGSGFSYEERKHQESEKVIR